MHLFMSFILRATAVFIKDMALFNSGETDHCSQGSVRTRLKPPPLPHILLCFCSSACSSFSFSSLSLCPSSLLPP